ncbi:cysteine hydrolase family protein [Subtercola frigoramans]|uniref:Nicotinamidase-related amidase n=1 Tax=Subtercola frigoramans TaxID=120298 RepID=A0ABS2L132_9MICO|nr:isochorismatase family cysteine hydrolase [Subtercola frigoramans]MBM7470782.1 nicotinamidase-related amidase [Subtercola frigoramans]
MTESTPTTAVLVVDMQNDTVHADGAYASFGAAENATSQNVIANIGTLLGAARESGVPVFHSRIVVYPLPGVGGQNAPVFRMLAPDTFKIGTWGAAIVDELQPQGDEILLDRTRMSVFNGTEIDHLLRNLGVSRLIVVGAWTNMAVEHTVRDAADHGYEVTIVSDGTSSLSADWQRAALEYALTNIATIADTVTVAAELRS